MDLDAMAINLRKLMVHLPMLEEMAVEYEAHKQRVAEGQAARVAETAANEPTDLQSGGAAATQEEDPPEHQSTADEG